MIHLKVQVVSFAYIIGLELYQKGGNSKAGKKKKSNYDRQLKLLKVKRLQNAHTWECNLPNR